MNEVKRQAMTELQKAVAEAERQARSTIANERTHMERALSEAKRQATEEALSLVGRQEDSSEVYQDGGREVRIILNRELSLHHVIDTCLNYKLSSINNQVFFSLNFAHKSFASYGMHF